MRRERVRKDPASRRNPPGRNDDSQGSRSGPLAPANSFERRQFPRRTWAFPTTHHQLAIHPAFAGCVATAFTLPATIARASGDDRRPAGSFAPQVARRAGARTLGKLGARDVVVGLGAVSEPFHGVLDNVGSFFLTPAFALVAPGGALIEMRRSIFPVFRWLEPFNRGSNDRCLRAP